MINPAKMRPSNGEVLGDIEDEAGSWENIEEAGWRENFEFFAGVSEWRDK